MGLFQKLSEGLKKTRDSMKQALDAIGGHSAITEETFEDLEEGVLLAGGGGETSEEICAEVRARVKKDGVTDPGEIKRVLRETIAQMLTGGQELDIEKKPAIIMMIGVNGVGKTTTIGKLAARLHADGMNVVLAAADTFRAAAIEQLEVWSERSGAEMIKHSEGSDPAAVLFDAIAAGKARRADVIICDTAGRLHNKKGLMDELAKMSRLIEREAPDSSVETLLVLDATTGQNAVNQAREFKNSCGLTGIVLTKLDGTARGGVVIGIKRELGIPIKFIGVGEGVDDLQPFDPEAFADALFE